MSQDLSKQHRQNEPAGQVDDPTREEFCVTGDARHVGTTGVLMPVKNNTDRIKQLVSLTFLAGWRSE